MKLQVCRLSGQPLLPEDVVNWHKDWQAGYDAAEQKNRVDAPQEDGVKFIPIDAIRMQKDLAELEKTLDAKYKLTSLAVLPKSAKAWAALIDTYDAPIMIAKSRDNPKELVLVIVDKPLGL